MPLIHRFDGVKIQMYMNDHPPPHFHAEYGEYKVLIEIATQQTLQGKLPKAQLKGVQNWAKENQQELAALFNRLNPPIKR